MRLKCSWIKRVFGSVVVVTFQIAFRAEIHVNDVFLFFKNHFWYQHIKTIQKVQTAFNFSKKKKKNWNSLKSRLNSRAKRSLRMLWHIFLSKRVHISALSIIVLWKFCLCLFPVGPWVLSETWFFVFSVHCTEEKSEAAD